jgi:hypothetical protein
MKHAVILSRAKKPDLWGIVEKDFDWPNGNVKEVIARDKPEALSKCDTLVHYYDTTLNHMKQLSHDSTKPSRSINGVLHLFNETLIEWCSKKEETVAYGLMFIAAGICVDQIVDSHTQLWYIGVPILNKVMFFDNKTVIDGANIPHAKLHKHHNTLSFNCVREAMASCFIKMFHIPGEHKPPDILSIHWGYHQVWPMLQDALFYQETKMDLMDDSKLSHRLQAYCKWLDFLNMQKFCSCKFPPCLKGEQNT